MTTPTRKQRPLDVSATAGAVLALAKQPVLKARQAPPGGGHAAAPASTKTKKVLGFARRQGGVEGARAPSKLFVLDTNVMMHDPMSLYSFAEHDVFLPMVTLEELDNNKKGTTDAARNARQVSRELDALATDYKGADQGIELSITGHKAATGKLFFQAKEMQVNLPAGLPASKNDNQILGVVQALMLSNPDRAVTLVSKDINVRIKARAMGMQADDYFSDKALEDGDVLHTGVVQLPANFWKKCGRDLETWTTRGETHYRITGPAIANLVAGEFVYLDSEESAFSGRVIERDQKSVVIRTTADFTKQKGAIWGVVAKNREQNFALNALMNKDIDFVTLTGQAGTGKTLMTLAAALAQVIDDKLYTEIIITRATVPVGEDIGFLPGNEEEKMSPWMGAVEDNLEVLSNGASANGDWNRAATASMEALKAKIKIKSMNFMRGRTFFNRFVIVDEAQNLTPKQMKTLITRAGPGTKIVCLGNLAQIDTPYLTEGSSGLTYAVDHFKGWAHGAHVTLQRGERSRLADFACEVL